MHHIVDFHSHILPGIDDGSRSVEESIAMLRLEAEQGIRHVVATPHFYAQQDNVEKFLKRRSEAEKRLREAMEKYDDLPEVIVGAEVYFYPNISESNLLNGLTIGKSGYILLEMPDIVWTGSMYREMELILSRQGLTPIIAHVDRYFGRFRTFGIPEKLEGLPVLVQANASFFNDQSSRSRAMRMLRNGQIHLLGSDCHNLHSRRPDLGKAIEKIQDRLGEAPLAYIEDFQNQVFNL